jgi:hypothetical protein
MGTLKSKNSACFRRNRYDSMSQSTQIFSTTIGARNITRTVQHLNISSKQKWAMKSRQSVLRDRTLVNRITVSENWYTIYACNMQSVKRRIHVANELVYLWRSVRCERQYKISQGHRLSLVWPDKFHLNICDQLPRWTSTTPTHRSFTPTQAAVDLNTKQERAT